MSEPASCPHRPPCPGCPRFGESTLPESAAQQLAELAASAGLPAPVLHTSPGAGAGHRHRARLAVRGRSRSPKIGLFQSGSHRIVDTPRCAVHHPLINEVVAELKRAIRETDTAPYADKPHKGALRYVQLVVERATQRAQVVLVGNGETPAVLGDLPAVFAERLADRLHSLFFNAQPDRSNAVLGPKTTLLSGLPATCEEIGGAKVYFPAAAFGQNHLPLFERAVDRIHTLVEDGTHVQEYYCGVGAIGLGLLGRVRQLDFNERSPAGLEGLELGLRQRPKAEQARAQILRGAAGDQVRNLGDADVVIVDPPRKGLDAALMEAILEDPPKRLIYLACGLPALVQELEALREAGRMRLSGIEAFDFFPFTDHLETLVWLDRNERE